MMNQSNGRSNTPYRKRFGSSRTGGIILRRNVNQPARGLVVLVHGCMGASQVWDSLIEQATYDPHFDEWDFLLVDYASNRRSRLEIISAGLSEQIDVVCTKWQYQQILLVGDNTGGLATRRAFTFALGATGQPREWANRVDRIVLLSTPNRGYPLKGLGFRSALTFLRFFPNFSGVKLMLEAERGSEFLTQLSLDWVNLLSRTHQRAPTIVQIVP